METLSRVESSVHFLNWRRVNIIEEKVKRKFDFLSNYKQKISLESFMVRILSEWDLHTSAIWPIFASFFISQFEIGISNIRKVCHRFPFSKSFLFFSALRRRFDQPNLGITYQYYELIFVINGLAPGNIVVRSLWFIFATSTLIAQIFFKSSTEFRMETEDSLSIHLKFNTQVKVMTENHILNLFIFIFISVTFPDKIGFA